MLLVMRLKKLTASLVLLAFTGTQVLWAADPRVLLEEAKNSFNELEGSSLPPAGVSSQTLVANEETVQSAVDQQNALQDLQNLGFSLTTPNGDILQYVNGALSKVTRADGTVLRNLRLNSDGSIASAVECTQEGAYCYLEKPCEFDRLMEVLKNAYMKRVMNKNKIEEKKMDSLLTVSQAVSARDVLRRLKEIDDGNF